VTAVTPAWTPSAPYLERSRLRAFALKNGCADYAALMRWSTEDLEGFWAATERDLHIAWRTPYTRVLDSSRGIPWTTWWTGGRMNYVATALRHDGDRVAIVAEGEEGTVRTLTYRELSDQVASFAAGLRYDCVELSGSCVVASDRQHGIEELGDGGFVPSPALLPVEQSPGDFAANDAYAVPRPALPSFAALDLGTNNCRLLIARPAPMGSGGGFRVIDAFSRIVRLGEGMTATGALSEAAVERTIEALRICAGKIGHRRVATGRTHNAAAGMRSRAAHV